MDIIDFQKLNESKDPSMTPILGQDIFGLLDAQNEAIQEEDAQEEEKIVHFKYSDQKKKKLIAAIMTSYVNDYGKNDPYHIDNDNSFVSKVKNQIHAIYGNRSIVQYIIAMRDVFKVYQEMYKHSSNRLIMGFPEYISAVVSGDIPAPFNHPLIRTNVPPEIIMRYILDEKLDPEDIKKYLSTANDDDGGRRYVFDFTTVEEDFNTPIEYGVMDEKIQKRMLQSWLAGKLQTQGLSRNESNLVYGLTSIYDKIDIQDPESFKFDQPISHHSDIVSWKNVKRSTPKMVHLKEYTQKALQDKHRGDFIRRIMSVEPTDTESPEVTLKSLMERMEANAAKRNQPISTFKMISRMKLYSQGVVSVKLNKYGREVYKYRDNNSVKSNSVKQMLLDIERKAELFKDMTDAFYDRIHSPNFQGLLEEIRDEQAIIQKYGLSYYTEGD